MRLSEMNENNILDNNNKEMNCQNASQTERQYYDHINLEHIKSLLSLSDDELIIRSDDGEKRTIKDKKEHIKGLRRLFATWVNSKKDKHLRNYSTNGSNRLYAKGAGVSYCKKDVRNFVCADYCRDYDMVNCHPTLILHLLKLNKLPHTFFQQYIDNRDELLDNAGLCKQDVLSRLNQDKPKLFTSNEEALVINQAIKEWTNSKRQIIEIYKNKCIGKNYKYDSKKGNPISSKCSAILWWHENLLLCRCMDRYADKISVPMYDGFIATSEISIDELNQLTADYGMKWVEKPMATIFDNFEFPENEDTNVYEDLKKRFEKECFLMRDSIKCKMLQPHIKDGIKWATKDWKDVALYYKKFQTFNDEGKKVNFTDVWIEDENRLEYFAMDFVPYNSKIQEDPIDKGIFNLFEGFKCDYVDGVTAEDVKWFLDFIRTILDEEGVAEYVINYIAHLIKKPRENPAVALVIKGQKGTGKDTLGMIIENLVGTSLMCKGQGMEDIFGTWNDHLANKLVGIMNEVEGKDGIKFMENLKERITNPKFSIKERFVTQKCNMDWIMRLIILSNNYTPVQVDNCERRFMIARVNDVLHGNTEYWNELYKNIQNPDVMNKLYSWLTDVDIKDWVPKDNVPITETYKNMATRNIAPPRLYLWHKIHTEEKQESEEPIIILQSLFNREVQEVSKKVLGWTEAIRKKQIKCEMESDNKYITNKSHNFGKGSGQMAYIINNPKKYIQHLKKFDFKTYKEEAVDWGEYQFIDDSEIDDSKIDDDLD